LKAKREQPEVAQGHNSRPGLSINGLEGLGSGVAIPIGFEPLEPGRARTPIAFGRLERIGSNSNIRSTMLRRAALSERPRHCQLLPLAT
jgi:hypothetical protein